MANTPVPVKGSAPAATYDPWRSLRGEMDRLFDRFGMGFGALPSFPTGLTTTAMPMPAVDIQEEEGAFKLTAELPGMTEKDVTISITGDTLSISGEKRQESEKKEKNYHLTERSYGSFQRAFYLPEGVDREKIEAGFANGVLTVTMPKVVPEAARKIEVKAA